MHTIIFIENFNNGCLYFIIGWRLWKDNIWGYVKEYRSNICRWSIRFIRDII